jgi:hypothetical protein
MGNRKSDHCVVLMITGNAGGGKANKSLSNAGI